MLKTIKIFVLAFILSFLTFNYVYAMDINMNLSNTNISTNSSSIQNTNTAISNNNNTIGNTTNNYYSPVSDDYSVSLGTMNDLPENELGFTNILNIILIVVGILLILLGIAIMIRLK